MVLAFLNNAAAGARPGADCCGCCCRCSGSCVQSSPCRGPSGGRGSRRRRWHTARAGRSPAWWKEESPMSGANDPPVHSAMASRPRSARSPCGGRVKDQSCRSYQIETAGRRITPIRAVEPLRRGAVCGLAGGAASHTTWRAATAASVASRRQSGVFSGAPRPGSFSRLQCGCGSRGSVFSHGSAGETLMMIPALAAIISFGEILPWLGNRAY